MRFFSVLFLGLLCLAAVRAEDVVDEKDVVVLGQANFTELVGKSKFALVEFYAPWCGHCKALKAPWAEAATTLKDVDAAIVLGKVDVTEEKELGEKYEIKGFPTLKWFVDGEMALDYSGGRTAPEIVAWIKKKTGPPSTVVDSAEALEKAKKDEVSMFGYFGKLEGDEHAAFEALASKTEDTSFYKITDAALAKTLGLTSAPSFAVGRNYPSFDFEAIVSTSHEAMKGNDPIEDRLTAFLTAEKLPAFLEFSPKTSGRIFGSGVSSQVIVTAPESEFKEGSALRKALTEASSKTRGTVVWVTARVDSEAAAPILNYFGLDKESMVAQVVGFQSTGGLKFSYTKGGKLDAKTLAAFAVSVADGTAERMLKSAPVPEEPLDEGVTVIVGSTVEEIVMDPKKDVLLEVYAPWCGHCKQLAPIYSKLAKRFSDVDSVVIAKMDGTENEHPDISVSGYPTILFYPAEKGAKPITMEGARDLAGLTKFIKEHAKTKYELPKKTKEEEEADEATEEEGHDEL